MSARRPAALLALAASALCALGAAGAAVVAERSAAGARATLADTVRLQRARAEVARAEAALGGTDLDDAIARAQRANAVAERVQALTARIVALLEPARADADALIGAARGSLSALRSARAGAGRAAELLAALAGYQRAAGSSAAATNASLRRILAALEELNRSLPGPLEVRR